MEDIYIYTHRCVHICLDLQRDIDMLTWVNTKSAFNVSYSRETSRMLGCLAPESPFALLATRWWVQGPLLPWGWGSETALQLNFSQGYQVLTYNVPRIL